MVLQIPNQPETRRTRLKASESVPAAKLLLKKVFVGIGIFLLTLVFIEIMARFVIIQAKPAQATLKEFDVKYELASQFAQEKRPMVMLMGDSIMDFDVFPEHLEYLLGKQGKNIAVKNMAVASSTPRINTAFLEGLLRKKIKPRLIVYNIHPRVFNQKFVQNTTQNGEASFFETYPAQCLYHKPSGIQRLDCALQEKSYLYRFRHFFKEQLAAFPATILHPEAQLTPKLEGFVKSDFSPSGWATGYQVYQEDRLIADHITPNFMFYYTAKYGNFQWDAGPMSGFAALCEKNHIPLVLVWLPEHAQMEKIYTKLQFNAPGFQQHLTQWAKPLGVEIWDMHHQQFSEADYQDFNHLNVLGSPKLSKSLSERLIKSRYIKQPAI